jgi:2-dehydropantoate 2-reductase
MAATGTPQLLVWGTGAVGGTVAAHLARSGHALVCVDVNANHVRTINQAGLRVIGPVDTFTARPAAACPQDLKGIFDRILLCVKANRTADAAAGLAPHLANGGCVVSLQNGLNELTLVEVLGRERTIGAFINFSAELSAPGEIHFGGRGSVVIGELDGATTPRIEDLHRLFLGFDSEAQVSDNVLGFLWGKLIFCGFLKITAVADLPIREGLAASENRTLFAALACEMLAAAGARPMGFDGFEPDAIRDSANSGALNRTFDAMDAFTGGGSLTHSATWRDPKEGRRHRHAAVSPAPRSHRRHRGWAPRTGSRRFGRAMIWREMRSSPIEGGPQ